MNVHLNSHVERLVKEQLAQGGFRSPEEVIERAVETFVERRSHAFSLGPRTKTHDEAAADIVELRKGVLLGGLKIKDLIHEGRRI